MIYCGYPCIGKSSYKEQNFIDLESSNFGKEPGWLIHYIQVALSLQEQGYNVFLSTHKAVRDYLSFNGIPFVVIYPSLSLKEEWIDKLKKRFLTEPTDKNKAALERAENYYHSDIEELMEEEEKIEITSMDYNLKELIRPNSSFVPSDLYYKDDKGNFVHWGTTIDDNCLPDGVWYITNNGKRKTSMDYLARVYHMKPEKMDVNVLCSLEDATEYVLNSQEWREFMEGYYSLADAVSMVIKILQEKQ